MQSFNKTTKSKTVPVFIAICGVAIIGSAIIGMRNSFSANIQEETKVEQVKKEEVSVDKVYSNKRLNELQFAVNYALDGERSITTGAGNVLKYDAEKIKFAFVALSYDANGSKVKRNVNSEGLEIMGSFAVDKEYYIDFYQELFHSGVNEDVLAQVLTEKDGYLYGSIMSGLSMDVEVYKVNKVYKSGKNLEVVIDVLEVSYDDEVSVKYMDENENDYPESAVAYQITLNLTENSQVYTINSMVA